MCNSDIIVQQTTSKISLGLLLETPNFATKMCEQLKDMSYVSSSNCVFERSNTNTLRCRSNDSQKMLSAPPHSDFHLASFLLVYYRLPAANSVYKQLK